MNRTRELVGIANQNNVLELILVGKSAEEVADELGLAVSTVKKHINKALEEAKSTYEEYTGQLLAKNYLRADKFIERLTVEAFANEYTDLSRVDRITKLLELQNKMLMKEKPIKVQHGGDSENPIMIEQTFHMGDPVYAQALKMAQADPTLLLIDPKAEQLAKYIDAVNDVVLEEADYE